ncbi:MAG: hypothetical protein LBP63_01555 [Prevotellaceae bacterium]|jgi:hypothetical protein|nr:hypothetical protein [Prevotellaceae bacterium]
MKKYIIAVLALVIVAFSLFGLDYLAVLIFNRSNSLGLTWCLGMSLALYAIEFGAKPTKVGRKSDLKLLIFLTAFVIIAIIITGSFFEHKEWNRLIIMCIAFPFMMIATYCGMAAYANWSNKHLAKKKNKEIIPEQ